MHTPALLVALLLATPTHAAPDLVELAFGSGNVNGAIGNGGLTLGISHLGEVAVLTWPSPSYTDQLLHLGTNHPDRHRRRSLMSHPSMGATLALSVTVDGAAQVTHLGSADWSVAQSYPDPLAPLLETRHRHDGLGLTVVVTDFVRPDVDVWVRHVELLRDPDSPVRAATLLAHHNLSPTVSRVPQLPLADWAMDAYNDYAAIWDVAHQQLTHFRPAGRGDLSGLLDLVTRPPIDYGPLGLAATTPLTPERVASLSTALDSEGPGAYLVLASSMPIEGVQVGFDDTPTCDLVDDLVDNVQALPELLPGVTLPLDPSIADVLRCDRTPAAIVAENGWTHVPTSAFEDMADGQLEGSHLAVGQVDTALAIPLPFDGDRASATLTLAAAATASEARGLSTTYRGVPVETHRAALDAHWHPLLGAAQMPTGVSERLLTVCRRALMNLLIAQDRHTGAIVASIARQAPYGLDWPRDGAFFNVALDVAGLHAQASHHGRFTMSAQRRDEVAAELLINTAPPPDPDDPNKNVYPAFAWEMNYYADGLVGGNIRWEIDNTGLAVWGLVDHARYLSGAERTAWQEEIWPTVASAVDLLARWRDGATGLHAPAFEDDNHHPSQTLHGAITTWLALDVAADLGQALATPAHLEASARWRARADELRAAIETRLVDEETGLFIEGLDETLNPGNAAGGASAWALWPASLPAAITHREALGAWLLDLASERLDLAHGGGAYIPKILVAVARADDTTTHRARALELLERLARDTATPDTALFGEVFVAVDDDGDGAPDHFSARVSKPHVWAGVLTYLSAMALSRPERFDDPLAPPAEVEGGSGCAGGGVSWVVVLGLALVLPRGSGSRARHSAHAPRALFARLRRGGSKVMGTIGSTRSCSASRNTETFGGK